jgi:hypothetical protein
LDNDKAFAAYALILIAGVASLLTTLVLTGPGTWPSPVHILEHVAMGLAIRAGYKSVGGWSWADWSVAGDRVRDPITAGELLASSGAHADALS